MRRLSLRSSSLSLAALFAASLIAAAGCVSLSLSSSGTDSAGSLGVGGGIVLPSGGGGGYSASSSTGGDTIPPYLMGSYAYLCGGDKATCVPGNGICTLIDPTKNDGGISGVGGSSATGSGTASSASSASSSGIGGSDPSGSSASTSGVGGSTSGVGSSSSGVGGSTSGVGSSSSGVGGSTSGVGGSSSGVGGSTSGIGGGTSGVGSSSSGVGGSTSGIGGGTSGVGGSSSGVGGSTSGVGGTTSGVGGGTSGAGGGTSGGDAGAPTLTCKLSPVGDKALAECTTAGDSASGDPCQSAADCGVGLACIATLSGGLCRPYCCGQVEECPNDTYCAPTPMAEGNIKVPVCLPAHNCKLLDDTTCTNGQTCTIVRDNGTTSCVDPGMGERGEACPCSPGQICSKFTNTCLKLCHIGNDAADCGAGSCQGGVMAYPEGIGICVGYP